MVTTEDIAEAVKQRWVGGGATLTPIKLIEGRVPDQEAAPYTSFKVMDKDTQRIASFAYLQTFVVEFRTWVENGNAPAGPIKQAIETLFSFGRTEMSLPNARTLQILHSVKAPGGLDEDPQTQQAKAVKVSTDRFEILCQG